MKIAIAKEIQVDERRVALVPDVAARLVKQGIEVWLEAGAGERAFFSDATYEEVGVKVAGDGAALWRDADIVLKVGTIEDHEVDKLREGSILIGFLNPLGNPGLVQKLADRKVTAF
ncbi:MAG: NAD(P)(+) transhydrogenase (Re/Si-specific) subunit alpha, partial [Cyanobacteriota bacterium]|nr:NAD(P)(+) transhydrogenase (Re/Si-specific) subunit alpha [Cyanobacteriota bacterium]